MSVKASFIDRLGCPDCGALAERLGHYYDAHDGTGFEADCVYSSKKRNGEPRRMGEPGVVRVQCGSKTTTRFGSSVTEDVTRELLPLTHICTNPDCSVVFAECQARRFTGELPPFAVWPSNSQ